MTGTCRRQPSILLATQLLLLLSALCSDYGMCASDSGMSDPSRMVVGVAGPVSFYNGGSDHFATDHFLEQFLPVRRENKDNIENILDDMEHGVEELSGPKSCLNVTCHPEPFCAKYIMVPGECCARCSMAIRQWRSCRHCTPTEGCLKYRAPKRGQGCCATCVKRKNRFSAGPCATALCPAHRVCRVKNGEAVCLCKKNCPKTNNPVCGADGVTYRNSCYRKREECATGVAIPLRKRTAC